MTPAKANAASARTGRRAAPRRTTSHTQVGFSLLEVLVAVLVLCLTLLAVAGLAVKSLSSNNSSMSRSVATIAMYSIQEAMRADLDAAKNGAYNGSLVASTCPAVAGSLAQIQLNQWCEQQLQHKVLGGSVGTTKGTITCDANGLCTVTITWDDSRNPMLPAAPSTNNTQTVTTTGML
jgi:type IV pilus assembly protein PilV